MKKITCEMCGSSDMLKQDGAFVCQVCGTKYSVEEAKKMMVEVDGMVEVTGTVAIDNANQINSYYDLAEKYLETDINKAEEYCDKILEIDSKNYRGWLLKFKIEHYKCNEIFNDDSTNIYDDKVSRRLKEKDIWGKDKYEYINEEIELRYKKANQYIESAFSFADIDERQKIKNTVYDVLSLYTNTLFKRIKLNKAFIDCTINYFFDYPHKILLDFIAKNYNEDENIKSIKKYIADIKNQVDSLFSQCIKSENYSSAINYIEILMYLIKSKSTYIDYSRFNINISEWQILYRQLRISKTILQCISEMESSKLELETTEDDEMYEWREYDDKTAYKIFNRNKKWLSYLNRKYIGQDMPTELKNKIEEYLNVTLPTLSNSSVEHISPTHEVYHRTERDVIQDEINNLQRQNEEIKRKILNLQNGKAKTAVLGVSLLILGVISIIVSISMADSLFGFLLSIFLLFGGIVNLAAYNKQRQEAGIPLLQKTIGENLIKILELEKKLKNIK